MKLRNKVLVYKVLSAIFGLALIIVAGNVIKAYSGDGAKVVVEGDYIESSQNQTVGGFYSPDIEGIKDKLVIIAPTSIYATSTLVSSDSGTTYLLSASGTTITLPKVEKGLNFKFAINGAADTGNFIIDSAEGDNVDGTLIVAGAVVDCRGEDQINFVVDGEQNGDYVELFSDGSQWYIGDSGVLTASKMTCTDPS